MASPNTAALLLAAIASPLLCLAAPLTASCTKVELLAAADAYVAAQTTGNLSALAAFTSPDGWTYVQNNQPTNPSSSPTSVLTRPLKIDHRRTNTDLVQCATYTELISVSGPYVIGTQIHHSPSTPSKVTLIDSVASTRGSWLFDAAKTLSYVRAETWDPIPESKRDSRELIKAVGDAYMDIWSNATAHLTVPWGTPCARLEGGSYTGTGAATDSCMVGIPSNHSQAPNSRRRYVVDEEVGSVSILCVWEHMMNAADSHEFRLEGGRLRYVHTMTECGGRTCRL